jgi:ABC-2 type transport system permease protein
MFVAFGMMLVIQSLTADREDGTLLRAKATPGGVGLACERPSWGRGW